MSLYFFDFNNPYFIFGSITAFMVINLALMVWVGNKKEVPRLFAVATFFTGLWTIFAALDYAALIIDGNTMSKFFLTYITKITYMLGIPAGAMFFYFCYRFTTQHSKRLQQRIQFMLLGLSASIMTLVVFTDLFVRPYIIEGPIPKTITEALTPESLEAVQYVENYGPLIGLYNIIILFFFVGGATLLWRAKKYTRDSTLKKQLTYMAWALTIAFTAYGITDVIMPVILEVDYGYVGMLTANIWVFLIGYSIIKHNQMNVRVVTSEILIVLASLLLFLAIFI